jgi:hypothetical protein
MTDQDKPGLVDDSLEGLTYKVIGLAMAVPMTSGRAIANLLITMR